MMRVWYTATGTVDIPHVFHHPDDDDEMQRNSTIHHVKRETKQNKQIVTIDYDIGDVELMKKR
jgi:hypothetical protein